MARDQKIYETNNYGGGVLVDRTTELPVGFTAQGVDQYMVIPVADPLTGGIGLDRAYKITLPNNSIGLTIPQADGKQFTIVTGPTTYGGYIDNSMSIGYNQDINGSLIPTEPYAVHTLETDYYDATIPNRSIEWYYAIGNPDVDGAVQFRPYGWNYDRADGKTNHYFRSSILHVFNRVNTFELLRLDDTPSGVRSQLELRGLVATQPVQTIWGALGQTANIWEVRSQRGLGSGDLPLVAAKDDATGNGVFTVNNALGQVQSKVSGNNSDVTWFTCGTFQIIPKVSGGGAATFGANAGCASLSFQNSSFTSQFELLLVTDFRLESHGNGTGIYSGGSRSVAFPAAGGLNVEIGSISTVGTLTTGAPAGGTAAAWKLGVVASVSPTAPNRTVEIDVGGIKLYVAAKTTND